jgi:hypothetical protein
LFTLFVLLSVALATPPRVVTEPKTGLTFATTVGDMSLRELASGPKRS